MARIATVASATGVIISALVLLALASIQRDSLPLEWQGPVATHEVTAPATQFALRVADR